MHKLAGSSLKTVHWLTGELPLCARSSGDRALPCGGRGRRFKSCRAYQVHPKWESNPYPSTSIGLMREDSVRWSAYESLAWELWAGYCPGFPRPLVDLSGVETIDPFAICLLALYVRRCSEAGGRARILLPEREEARKDLAHSGLFQLVGDEL